MIKKELLEKYARDFMDKNDNVNIAFIKDENYEVYIMYISYQYGFFKYKDTSIIKCDSREPEEDIVRRLGYEFTSTIFKTCKEIINDLS